MSKIVISLNELSSASCDLHDIIESLRKRKGLNGLPQVKGFVESLYPSDYPTDEIYAEAEVDPSKLDNCIAELETLIASLDKKFKQSPKDNEGSEITIEDCLSDVLNFLESLAV